MNRREPDSGAKTSGTDSDATIRAAWLYYHHDLTQAEIAKQLQVSRPTVAIGCLNSGELFNPIRLAGFMAEKLGAKVYHLPVPAVVSSVGLKQILLEDENIRSCLEMAKSASRAMIGVGKVSNDATVVSAGFLDRTMIDELKTKGAVGDISCRYFDLNGEPVITDFDRRVISLSLDDLRRIKPVIAVAGGEDKVAAVLGALRTRCLDILITDEQTGQRVLALDHSTRPKTVADPAAKPAARGDRRSC